MICVKLQGGLGNQMFQYALGVALSEKTNSKLVLDKSFLNKRGRNLNYTLRDYELDVFDEISSETSFLDRIKCKWLNLFWFTNQANKMLGINLFTNKFILEDNTGYDTQVNNVSNNALLIGNWQNERYFSNVRHTIIDRFQFKFPINEINADRIKRMVNSNSVSIHVRRGDYIDNEGANKNHGVCSLDYYNKAIDYMSHRIENPTYFVFSDDQVWVEENLKIKGKHEYVSGNFGKMSYIDMQLMSNCNHNIIANSSFSWWGAWLNRYEKKIIVAPKQWFADAKKNMNKKELIPSSWIRI